MEDSKLELLSSNNVDEEQVNYILQDFLRTNENVFSFPDLSISNKRVILWTSIFNYLQNKSATQLHPLCLAAIRVLSREKTDIDNIVCEKWITTLIEKAGLYNFVSLNEETSSNLDLLEKDVAVEALKCLCNIAFHSEVARALCAHTSIAQGLISRLRCYKDIPFKEDIMLYDMKLLFILTALRQDIRDLIKNQLHGMHYLINCLKELLVESSSEMEVAGAACVTSGHDYFLNDSQQAIICQILKAQFNLLMRPSSDDTTNEEEDAIFLELVPVLMNLLYARASSDDKLMEIRSDICNLLTCVPGDYYTYLTPNLSEGETSQQTYDGKNMDALHALLALMQHRLTITTNTKTQYDNLSPILIVMNKAARGCRAHRKYLRLVVLPPLRDVSRPPEKGNTLRNQLCRLLTTPVTSIRDLTAEFLFVLCKEKVGRLVKYTGWGNAAGHLAQKGLLCGGKSGHYSSSSEDSDTDEYLEAQPNIDPVTGYTRPPPTNPFEGMTEEQKEYEAMKLVNLFDKMVSHGIVKPARVGPDGRPQPVDHVMELRENPPNRSQS